MGLPYTRNPEVRDEARIKRERDAFLSKQRQRQKDIRREITGNGLDGIAVAKLRGPDRNGRMHKTVQIPYWKPQSAMHYSDYRQVKAEERDAAIAEDVVICEQAIADLQKGNREWSIRINYDQKKRPYEIEISRNTVSKK